MDRISELSDHILVKILLFLPTKVAVSTSLLSKRWDCVWMWLPKLEYVTTSLSESENLRYFLNRNLPLHKAPVIESFRLSLRHQLFKPGDVKFWILAALSRNLRELNIRYKTYGFKQELLPSSLFACESLVVLKLRGGIVLDVPRNVCLPALKTLQLRNIDDLDGKSVSRILSICPVLENLWLDLSNVSIYGRISVIVPSLQSLSVCIEEETEGLEIDTPSLKYFKLKDVSEHIYGISIENMPKLEEAYLDVKLDDIECLIGSIKSVKRLSICCSQAVYNDKFVFNQLEHLKLCDCTDCSPKVLARLLKDSPNLRALDIFQMEYHGDSNMVHWNEPSTIPECFLWTLQTFSWSGYLGELEGLIVLAYILKNSSRLEIARISSREGLLPVTVQRMIKECFSKASNTCQLIFD